ncbi:hypothetical protein AB0392_60520 [Nonomuraea angiospora]|uniref:hypothetical protein n=1 Tax=Nonomuraea angiospora TaxID=46172 RepID=UPI00344E80B0
MPPLRNPHNHNETDDDRFSEQEIAGGDIDASAEFPVAFKEDLVAAELTGSDR